MAQTISKHLPARIATLIIFAQLSRVARPCNETTRLQKMQEQVVFFNLLERSLLYIPANTEIFFHHHYSFAVNFHPTQRARGGQQLTIYMLWEHINNLWTREANTKCTEPWNRIIWFRPYSILCVLFVAQSHLYYVKDVRGLMHTRIHKCLCARAITKHTGRGVTTGSIEVSLLVTRIRSEWQVRIYYIYLVLSTIAYIPSYTFPRAVRDGTQTTTTRLTVMAPKLWQLSFFALECFHSNNVMLTSIFRC